MDHDTRPSETPATDWTHRLVSNTPASAPPDRDRELAPPKTTRRLHRAAFAQYACLLLGLSWAVTGGIALARMSMVGDAVTVAGSGFTQPCAWGTLTAGIIIMLIGAFGSDDRGVLMAMATMLLAPGLVIAAVPDAFTELLGATSFNGIAMCLSAIALVAIAELQRAPNLPRS